MKIEIKERLQASGNKTLYLEYYEKGFRKKENLHLTIYPETSRAVKKLNLETYANAQAIRSDRILNPPTFVVSADEPKNEDRSKTLTWLQWAEECVKYGEQEGNGSQQIRHKKLICKRIKEYLTRIEDTKILLKDVGTKHIKGFYDYLRNGYRNKRRIKENKGRLSECSLAIYGQTTNAMFNRAVREELIPFNPVQGLEGDERFYIPDSHREFLTPDEVKRFLAVEPSCEQEGIIQKAFGFSCFTGLRISDMLLLRWSHIKPMGEGLCVHLLQKKTKHWVTVPLNDMALSLLPPRPKEDCDDLVFKLIKTPKSINKYVKHIVEQAGIEDKKITYHCSRHTVATLAISAGADIKTVSSILGHRSTVCTQVYAKVCLEKKIEAVNLTDGVFD